MYSKLFNTTGLILSIVGTYFVFRWGLTLQAESYGLGLEDGNIIKTKWGKMTVREATIKQGNERARHLLLSQIGLGLISLGFVFQMIATWI